MSETAILNPNLIGQKLIDDTPAAQQERAPREPLPPDKHGWWWGIGRRKTASARVRIRPAREGEGKGVMKVQTSRKNFKTIEEYFTEVRDQSDCYAPLRLSNLDGKLDVYIRATGGGTMGQAQAVRLGLSRALLNYDPTLEPALRNAGFLTRDAREVERKKYGLAGARRRFQFSKR